jgi:hypothetical protein
VKDRRTDGDIVRKLTVGAGAWLTECLLIGLNAKAPNDCRRDPAKAAYAALPPHGGAVC